MTTFVLMIKFRVKMIRIKVQLLTLFIFSVALSGQSLNEMKKIFAHAEYYFLYEEYELANQLYLLLDTPDNLNIKYKIGICFLNTPGEKGKAIPYLEAASSAASYESKTKSFSEIRAPLDAWFFLAKAYMINNDLEEALNTLLHFKQLANEAKTKGGMKNLNYADQQIVACKNAIEFRNNPVVFSKTALGSDFSQGSVNKNPAVSFDGNTMVFTERRGAVNAIFISKKESGIWQKPVEITSELNAGYDCSSCSLNSDGTELYLYKSDVYDGAIYSSNYENGAWSQIKKLNKNINTKFYESHASVSSNGKKLYFTSNRDGGRGNLDIYVSEKAATGDWGPALNLGSVINTPFNEDTPFITQNDSSLYFCSEGHNSMGGFDNFKSLKIGTLWTTPLNLGFPINTTDDDKFFQPDNNGRNAYYSLTTDYKKKEIFYLSMGSPGAGNLAAVEDKINPVKTPVVPTEDTSILIRNMKVFDAGDKSVKDADVLYYTVQVMALHKPVNISFFKYITDTKVLYTDADRFFRYTTGRFDTKEKADSLRLELRRKGYPEEIFIKKVTR